jgi:hypothetical protein
MMILFKMERQYRDTLIRSTLFGLRGELTIQTDTRPVGAHIFAARAGTRVS